MRGDWGGGGKDEAGAGSAAYDVGDDARGEYVAEDGAASCRRAVCGDCALVHSSSGSSDAVTAAAARGGLYNAVGLNVGARGRGACRRGSGAYPTA